MRTNEGCSAALRASCPLAEASSPGRSERNDGDVAGVGFFGVGFEGVGDRGQGVALAVGVPGGVGGWAHQLGEFFHSPRGAAAAFDAARAAGGEQPRAAADGGQHAQPIATDHAAAFVGDGVGGRLELDAAMDERAQPHQLIAVVFVLLQPCEFVKGMVLGGDLADGGEKLFVAAIGGGAGVDARHEFENGHGGLRHVGSAASSTHNIATGATISARSVGLSSVPACSLACGASEITWPVGGDG